MDLHRAFVSRRSNGLPQSRKQGFADYFIGGGGPADTDHFSWGFRCVVPSLPGRWNHGSVTGRFRHTPYEDQEVHAQRIAAGDNARGPGLETFAGLRMETKTAFVSFSFRKFCLELCPAGIPNERIASETTCIAGVGGDLCLLLE